MAEGLAPQQVEEQQQQGLGTEPSPRSVAAAAGIALFGVKEIVPPLELPDGRIYPGNIIPSSD